MATKEECIIDIYDDILKLSDQKIADIVYQIIKNDILIKFIFVQIKNKNLEFLQLLWHVFKKYVRKILCTNSKNNSYFIQLL